MRPPWQPLLDPSCPNHGLVLPTLLCRVDALGGPMLGPSESAETHEHTRGACHDTPIVVPAIRDFWTPRRVAEARRQA